MKVAFTTIASLVTLVTFTHLVHAQDYAVRHTNNGTAVIHDHASTYAEGVLRGSADFVRGLGDYNYNTSLAMINGEVARSKAYDNEIKKVQTYFGKRALNREYRNAENPRHTSEEIARYVAKRPVTPLSPTEVNRQVGQLHWPVILQHEAFQAERETINRLFAERTVEDSGKGSLNDLQTQQSIDSMRATVKANARTLGANNYIIAKRFLDGLKLESATPVGIVGLASVN